MRSRVAWQLRAMFVRALLVAAFVGFVPTQAKGPLDGERIIAGVRMFYGPRDDLQQVDTDLIARARESIDMAAYVLTNGAVTDALTAAARRGVRVRLYLDPDQPPQAGRAAERLMALARTPGIAVRVKQGNDIMHLKAFQVDRRLLRTGSANFSIAGLQRQENDIVVIEAQDAVARFLRDFENLWARPENLVWRGEAPLGAPKARQGAWND